MGSNLVELNFMATCALHHKVHKEGAQRVPSMLPCVVFTQRNVSGQGSVAIGQRLAKAALSCLKISKASKPR